VTCSSCGAPMRLKHEADYFTCDYCRNVYFPEANADGVRVLEEPASEACPVCAIPLVQASMSGRRFLYCTRCHGALVAMEAFVGLTEELRSHRDTSSEGARQPDWNDLNRKASCPKCGHRMDTHPYYGPGNVIIDSCESCSVIWLDYGELERIVRAPDRHYSPEESTAGVAVKRNTSGRA